jgi:hypothetical protein
VEPTGWFLLVFSWTALSALVYYCLSRIVREDDPETRPPPDGEPGSG